jgi:hypothetical protein
MSAFGLGVALDGGEDVIIDSAIDNASLQIENISFDYPEVDGLPNSKGLFKIVESGVHFIGIAGLESIRLGVHFGKDNPRYFSPDFIIKIVKLIVVLVIVSLLIKPAFYGIIFIAMVIMWIYSYFKKKKDALEEKQE